jgi:hypothetical protein
MRQLVDRDHAASRRDPNAKQPGAKANQESRAHHGMMATVGLSRGKDDNKVFEPGAETSQIVELIPEIGVGDSPARLPSVMWPSSCWWKTTRRSAMPSFAL